MTEIKVADFNEIKVNTFHIMHQFCAWWVILWEMDKDWLKINVK
jgi:hypothetical protein